MARGWSISATSDSSRDASLAVPITIEMMIKNKNKK
jgi:hypothetical protein